MKILLIGATGGTGKEILNQALAQNHEVTALVRNPATLTLQNEHLKVVQGDVLDIASVEQAMAGQESVICSLGLSLSASRKPTTVLSDGTRNLIAAMNKQNVHRLICITGVGSGDSRGHGGFFYDNIFLPLLLSEGYADKTRQEEIIKQSTLDWVIVRPGILSNGAAKGHYRVMLDGKYRIKGIARADVAAFVLEQLTSDTYLKKTPAISY